MGARQDPLFPKQNTKILLLEGINVCASHALSERGYTNVEQVSGALEPAELAKKLNDVRLLGIRSRTQITTEVLSQSPRLIAIGCFSVGTNQVDLDAARALGIPVFNAPFSNTRSVAELTIGEIIMLFRRSFPRSVSAHDGAWDKSSARSHEVRGKTLGIVGYGNIGTQVANMAEALGMNVVYYDHADKLRHGNAKPSGSLNKLLEISDVISIHVPQTENTRNMIGDREISKMKYGAHLINNSRGNVVDLNALAQALRTHKLGGAAIDVFPTEPSSNREHFSSPLQGLENVILTPHIGGATVEAQERIGEEVAKKLADYSNIGNTLGSVNFPQVLLPPSPTGVRFLQVQNNIPGELGHLNEVFSIHGINISGQFYQTDGDIGYVVLDVDGDVVNLEEVLADIRALDGTIRARALQKLQ